MMVTSPHPFKPFSASVTPADAANEWALGSLALLYVMAYDHTVSVPDQALRFAEKVGVLSIARRETPDPVLRDVNRALDLIAVSLRQRDRLDRDRATALAALADPEPPPPPPSGGYRVRRPIPITPQPPAGATAKPF